MITDSFDPESRPIVDLSMFYGPKKHLVDTCLIIFSTVIYDYILENFPCTEIARIGSCDGSRPVRMFEYDGEKIAFYLSMIGSSLAGDFVAEANHLTGATRFIMSGSCGSLDEKATDGKYILPTQAYRGEGLSYYFAPPADYIDIGNADRLSGIFSELNIPYVKGRVWTTDSMLRETVNLVNRRKSEGCVAVEMELAGVQAVCDFYGWELYDFLAAGDVLLEEGYSTEKLSEANHGMDKLYIALEIAKRIRN